MKNLTLTFLLLFGVYAGFCSPAQKKQKARASAKSHTHAKNGKKHVVAKNTKPHASQNGQKSKQQINKDVEDQVLASIKGNNANAPSLDVHLKTDNSIFGKYCSLLGVMPTAMANFGLYSFIDNWMGVHYRYGGSSKKGIDCSAFVQQLYASVFNVNMVRTAFEQFNFCKLVFEEEKLKEGDLVFFRIKRSKISHVGIYLANNYFVHASVSGGVMISSLNEPYWKKYFAGAGTIAKDANCVSTL